MEANQPSQWAALIPTPGPDSHKHTRGRLGVLAGEPFRTGASRLAARAGLRVGAGSVRLLATPDAATIIAPAIEAIMLEVYRVPEQLEALAGPLDAVVAGPAAGLNEVTAGNVLTLARTGAVLVVDADALTIFRDEPSALFDSLDRDDVLTPHEGEFERLFPGLLAEGREQAAVAAASRAGAVVVLKGHETIIAAPDGRARVNPNGSPWLATAGSGDVLAGMIGGFAAQRMDSFDGACAAVWLHAAAAARFGRGLTADDLADLLPVELEAVCGRA